jgi:hypothetical protein
MRGLVTIFVPKSVLLQAMIGRFAWAAICRFVRQFRAKMIRSERRAQVASRNPIQITVASVTSAAAHANSCLSWIKRRLTAQMG